MWGVCLDFGTVQAGLFQTVIQYEINDAANYENGKVTILAPVTNLTIEADKIKRLEEAPGHLYGEPVSPRNHPEVTGVVTGICWHFKRNCYYYKIAVDGKRKNRRYFEGDLRD